MPRPRRAELLAYAACALVVAVLGWRALHAGDGTAAAGVPARATGVTTPAVRTPAGAGRAVVHVVGEVRRPGVYRLAAGARVQEAIARAGGATRKADLEGVNLAAKVTDAQQVIVPPRQAVGEGPAAGAAGPVAGGGGATAAGGLPVNLNTAAAAELDTLPGVGPATVQKILDFRASSGGFRSVDDLAQVPGIGPKRLATLRDLVRV